MKGSERKGGSEEETKQDQARAKFQKWFAKAAGAECMPPWS